MTSVDQWINITEASRRYGRSRHSIARLIKRQGIETRREGRSRLVRVVDIENALLTSTLPPRSEAQEVIDDALRVFYSAHHRLVSSLFPGAQRPLDIEEMRKGRLGQDLQFIVEMAYGERKEPRDQVNETIDSVFQLMFWAPMAEDYQIPVSIWETMLGQLISMAKFRAYDPSELMTVSQAAMQLGVTRPTVFRWMDEKHLDYVRDDLIGRTFVVREDVEMLLESVGVGGVKDQGQHDRGPPLVVHRKAVDAGTPTASPATTPTIPSRPRCVDAYGLYTSILPHAVGPLFS